MTLHAILNHPDVAGSIMATSRRYETQRTGAEDLAQEAKIQIWKVHQEGRIDPVNPVGFSIGVARRAILSAALNDRLTGKPKLRAGNRFSEVRAKQHASLDKPRKGPSGSEIDAEGPWLAMAGHESDTVTAVDLEAALSMLDDEDREIAFRYLQLDQQFETIGPAMGKSATHCRARWAYVKPFLADWLDNGYATRYGCAA